MKWEEWKEVKVRIDRGNEKQATETCKCHIITCYYSTIPMSDGELVRLADLGSC